VEIELINELPDVLPLHAVALCVEVERNVGKILAVKALDEFTITVRDDRLLARLLGEIDDGLCRMSAAAPLDFSQ
jgi:hypothetical protein